MICYDRFMKKLTTFHWFIFALFAITILGAESLNRPTQQVLGKIAGTSTSLDQETDPGPTQIDWQKISTTYPNYIYAYLELANLSWRQGDLEQAKIYLDHARNINPNHPQVILLEKIID